MGKSKLNPMLTVKRRPPPPVNSKLLKAPVPYRTAKSKRVFGIGR